MLARLLALVLILAPALAGAQWIDDGRRFVAGTETGVVILRLADDRFEPDQLFGQEGIAPGPSPASASSAPAAKAGIQPLSAHRPALEKWKPSRRRLVSADGRFLVWRTETPHLVRPPEPVLVHDLQRPGTVIDLGLGRPIAFVGDREPALVYLEGPSQAHQVELQRLVVRRVRDQAVLFSRSFVLAQRHFQDGEALVRLEPVEASGHRSQRFVFFSGRSSTSRSPPTLYVYDHRERALVHTPYRAENLALASDDRRLAVGLEGLIVATDDWQAVSRRQRTTLARAEYERLTTFWDQAPPPSPKYEPHSGFLMGSRYLVTAAGLYDAATGERVGDGHRLQGIGGATDPRGEYLLIPTAPAQRGGVAIWTVAEGRLVTAPFCGALCMPQALTWVANGPRVHLQPDLSAAVVEEHGALTHHDFRRQRASPVDITPQQLDDWLSRQAGQPPAVLCAAMPAACSSPVTGRNDTARTAAIDEATRERFRLLCELGDCAAFGSYLVRAREASRAPATNPGPLSTAPGSPADPAVRQQDEADYDRFIAVPCRDRGDLRACRLHIEQLRRDEAHEPIVALCARHLLTCGLAHEALRKASEASPHRATWREQVAERGCSSGVILSACAQVSGFERVGFYHGGSEEDRRTGGRRDREDGASLDAWLAYQPILVAMHDEADRKRGWPLRVVATADAHAKVGLPAAARPIESISPARSRVEILAADPRGRFAVEFADNRFFAVGQAQSKTQLAQSEINVDNSQTAGAWFTADGDRLVLSHSGIVNLYEVGSWRLITSVRYHDVTRSGPASKALGLTGDGLAFLFEAQWPLDRRYPQYAQPGDGPKAAKENQQPRNLMLLEADGRVVRVADNRGHVWLSAFLVSTNGHTVARMVPRGIEIIDTSRSDREPPIRVLSGKCIGDDVRIDLRLSPDGRTATWRERHVEPLGKHFGYTEMGGWGMYERSRTHWVDCTADLVTGEVGRK